jgi:hypothetical protein
LQFLGLIAMADGSFKSYEARRATDEVLAKAFQDLKGSKSTVQQAEAIAITTKQLRVSFKTMRSKLLSLSNTDQNVILVCLKWTALYTVRPRIYVIEVPETNYG